MTHLQSDVCVSAAAGSSRGVAKFWLLLGLAFSSLLATGCVRTMDPILTDEQVITDDSLIGRWVTKEGDESIEVQPSGKEKMLKVVYSDSKGKKGPFLVRLGKINELMVAEIRPDEPAPDASDVYKAHLLPLYSFFIVQQTTPRLVLSTMSTEWLKKYLEEHPGELQVRNPGNELIVTAPTADFQTFLLRHHKDPGAIGEEALFVRPGDATTRPAAAPQ